MITKSYEILKNSEKLSKCNIFLLYGENEGLKNDIVKSIKITVSKKKKFDIQSIYEDEVLKSDENFYNSIFSGSLFSNNKIITIKNCSDKFVKYLENIADGIPENIILILLSDLLDKKSKLRNFFEKDKKIICVPCYLDNERDLNIIALSELKKNNILISQESLNLIVEKSNNDRNNLRNEIEKIISFSASKKKIDTRDVRAIINFSGEYKSDIFINECLSGNILQFKKMLTEFYNGTINQIFLLRILNNKIQRLINLKKQQEENDNLENLINYCRPPIFWQEKNTVKKQLTIWKYNELKKVVEEMNEIESQCKKKPQISKIIFLNFFTQLCKKANSYSL